MQVLVLPWRYGQKKIGVEKGALSLLSMIIKKNTFDYKIINSNDKSNSNYHKTVFFEKEKIKSNCLVLGGDHSVAIGSVLGSLNSTFKNVGVLWIDAHPDINTMMSSESKNIHGMPLSFITGLETIWGWVNPLQKLSMKNLYYWGIRDIDSFESKVIKKSNIINNKNMAKNMIDNYDYIHLSLDIDGIDPKYMPSTGTPVKNGIELEDVNNIMNYLIKSGKSFTIDIVEYNPLLGSDKEKKITNDNISYLLDNFKIAS